MASPTSCLKADRLGVRIVFEVRHALLGYQLVLELVRVAVESKAAPPLACWAVMIGR